MPSETTRAELTAQVVFMDTVENAAIVRAWAARRSISLSQASREIFNRGLAQVEQRWSRQYGELTDAELEIARGTALQYSPKARQERAAGEPTRPRRARVVVPGGRAARKRAERDAGAQK